MIVLDKDGDFYCEEQPRCVWSRMSERTESQIRLVHAFKSSSGRGDICVYRYHRYEKVDGEWIKKTDSSRTSKIEGDFPLPPLPAHRKVVYTKIESQLIKKFSQLDEQHKNYVIDRIDTLIDVHRVGDADTKFRQYILFLNESQKHELCLYLNVGNLDLNLSQ